MYFKDVTLKRFEITDFPCVSRWLKSCSQEDLVIGENTRGNTLLVETTGPQQWFLGEMTIRLRGTLRRTSGCEWTLVNGTLEGIPDPYDFNKANRAKLNEFMVAVGRSLKNGTPFKIHFVGTKPYAASGGCGGF